MKVLYDYKGFMRPFGGIYEYGRQLILHLKELGVEPIIHGSREKLPEEWRDDVDILPLLTFKGWRKLGTDRFQTDYMLKKSGADLFHSLGYTSGFRPKVPVVMTCYDFIHEHYPEAFIGGNQENFAKFKRKKIMAADMLLPISYSTERDCQKFIPEYSGKSSVVHLGVDENFLKRDELEIDGIKQRYGLTKPYWVYSGPRHGYKNFTKIFSAFKMGGFDSEMELVSIGCHNHLTDSDKNLWAENCDEIPNGVRLLGFLPSLDRLRIIQGAAGVVVPTEYEGFGFPVLEAMASGVPVLCGRVASIPEVAGDCAVYVDVKDVDSIRKGLVRLREEDLSLMLESARIRAGTFTWRKCAEETLAAYEKTLSMHRK